MRRISSHLSLRYLLVVVLLALLIGAGVFLYFSAQHPDVQTTQAYLVAAQRLPAGTSLSSTEITTVEALPNSVPSGALPAAQQAAIVGALVTEALEKGDYITLAHLADAPGHVASGLPAGDRLVKIVTKGALMLNSQQPGDVFDLLLTTAGGSTLASNILVEGLTLRAFDSDGNVIVEVPLVVAIFLAEAQDGAKVAVLAAPAQEAALGQSLTDLCVVALLPTGQLDPHPAGTPCPQVYGTSLTAGLSLYGTYQALSARKNFQGGPDGAL